MGSLSLFYTFRQVTAIVVEDEAPHAVIRISPVETYMSGKCVMVDEIKTTLPQMRQMMETVKSEAQRDILGGAIQALTAAMK